MKLVGALLLLVCGGFWAETKNREEQRDIARVSALGVLLSQIGERIEGLCLPLDEILADLSPELLSACGMAAGTMPHVRTAVRQVKDREAAAVLAQVSATLGRGTGEDQVRLCRTAVERLERCRERMRAAQKNNARARLTLVMSAALGGIILLW